MSNIHMTHVACDNPHADTVPVPATWLAELRAIAVAGSTTVKIAELIDQIAYLDTDDSDTTNCPYEGNVEPFYVSRDQSDWDCPACGHRNNILHGDDD